MISAQTVSGLKPFSTLSNLPRRSTAGDSIQSLTAANMMFGSHIAAVAMVLIPTATPLNVQNLPSSSPCFHQMFRRDFTRSSTTLFATFSSTTATRMPLKKSDSKTRIGIIGGGIAGVTAAHSLAKQLHGEDISIVVMEGDSSQPAQSIANGKPPEWTAATARNANSLVPGAAMHLMSQKGTLFQVMRDTIREGFMLYVEGFQNQFDKRPRKILADGSVTREERIPNIDNFDVQPPYFALHPFRCIGLSATMEERISFIRFVRHFLSTCLFGAGDAEQRAACLVQLAKANRAAVMQEIKDGNIESKVGLSRGFLSLSRTQAKAEETVQECKAYGEDARLLSWDEATQLEPRLHRLPIKPLFAVHRTQDSSASCEVFVKHLIDKCTTSMGIEYHRSGKVVNLEALGGKHDKPSFRVTAADGSKQEFDVLILAAGVQTPLMAAKLGAGATCPTYPLRGYSLTFFTPEKEYIGDKSFNLTHQPFSLDSMYCSSVNPRMARFAGFGELVGYRDKAVNVPSVGPRVLARYARELCPDATVNEDDALQCFRPFSPDDLPLVGEVSSVPGLFLHTGHGTLGWTMALATADCVAQAVSDRLEPNSSTTTTFTLPDNSFIDRKILSPDRFV
jgi:D-amino-acid dehydrogenase